MTADAPPSDTLLRLRRALTALDRMQEELDRMKRLKSEPIAVIGMGCRFPGRANDPESYWRMLREGVDAVREVPPDRWDLESYYDPDPDALGSMYTRYGGFLDRVDGFDAQFFGIAPREAVSMDPQQRLLLEVTWEALEHAGIAPDTLAGSQTGVWIGILSNDYYYLQMEAGAACIDAYTGTGNTASVAAGRLSYVLGLRGPNMAVDTACSSSLVAAHLAMQSLRSGECDLALAGGVNLMLSPDRTIYYCRLHAMAADGRCKAFDAGADGYVRGEGCGIVVLKRLSEALRDGDRILAVIRGSAINQDGRSNGLTAPNGQAQEAVIRKALAEAGIAPGQVGYVEAHGTGTPLGDPIEVRALGAVLSERRPDKEPFALGSVKTNFGHLEGAAGVAALMKVVLMLQYAAVPPHLHLQSPSPHIAWNEIPVIVPTALTPWPEREAGGRIAGVNSFGLSGTNAHVILAEAPPESERVLETVLERPYLLALSARTYPALGSLAHSYMDLLNSGAVDDPEPLHSLCSTAAVRRSHFEQRLAVMGRSAPDLAQQIDAFLAGRHGPSSGVVTRGRRPRIAFVFPGQGGQWEGMVDGLFHHEPIFRAVLEDCARALEPYTGPSLARDLAAGRMQEWIDRIDLLQPALFAIMVGLTALWRSWGVTPDAVTGLSMGEVAAAHVAGALSLGDAARIICLRSRLLAQTSGRGAMAVVELSQREAERVIAPFADRVSIAICNSPRSTVLSGDPDTLRHVLDGLEKQGIFCRSVNVDVASHSPQMDALRQPLLDTLDGIAPGKTALPLYSTVTGSAVAADELGPGYWVRNLREPVQFARTVEALVTGGHDIFLEVSPHPVTLTAIEDSLKYLSVEGTALPSLRREDEYGTLMRSLGALYTRGYPIDWGHLYPSSRHSAFAPTYPWQRERFWIPRDPPRRSSAATRKGIAHPLLGNRVPSPLEDTTFEKELSPVSPAYLQEHRLHGAVVVPGAWHIAMALAAGEVLDGAGPHVLEDVYMPRAIVLPDGEERTVHLVIGDDGGGRAFRLFSANLGRDERDVAWTLHSTGTIRSAQRAGDTTNEQIVDLDAVRLRCQEHVPGSVFYERLRERGYHLGPTFETVGEVWQGDGEAFCRLRLPAEEADPNLAQILVIDCCLQLPAAIFPYGTLDAMYVPVGFDQFRLATTPQSARWAHASFQPSDGPGAERSVDIRLLDDTGHVVAEIIGLQSRQVDSSMLLDGSAGPDREDLREWLFEIQWEPCPLDDPTAHRTEGLGSWLIFADEGGAGGALAELLRASGERCVVVRHGAALDRREDGSWTIDPACPEHVRSVLSEACKSEIAPWRGLVHLWSLDAAMESIDDAAIEKANRLGCYSVLHLVQGLSDLDLPDQPRLWLVTRGAEAADGASPVAIAQAALCGLGRTIAYEHPELRCARLDLDPSHTGDEARTLYKDLVANKTEDSIAHRGGQRLAARLVPYVPHDRPQAPPFAFRPDATYLITGGTGALGLLVARWAVTCGARSVVLAGRNEPSVEALTHVETMRQLGAEVVIARADVSRSDDVAGLLGRIARDLPPLRGIVHAAGILDDGVLLQMTADRFERVMAPKVQGAWHLHALTAHMPLDHFILFSSASAMIGSPGQSNYAAANAFLDALSHYRQARGLPSLSIAWGPWANVGLAAQGNRVQRLASSGIVSMVPELAFHALEKLLRSPRPHVGVMRFDLEQWCRFYPQARGMSLLARLAPRYAPVAEQKPRADLRAELLAVPLGAQRRTMLESLLVEEIAHVLRLDPARVDARLPLAEQGFDSLMALELRNNLEAVARVQLSATMIWRYPTLDALATHLANKLEIHLEQPEATALARQQEDEMARTMAELASLSDEQMADLLVQKIGQVERKLT